MDQGSLWNKVYEQRSLDEQQRIGQERTEREGRILAIDGCYDHWQEVVPHVRAAVKDLVQPLKDLKDLPRPLGDYHLVALGCPGEENAPAVLDALLQYLEGGGCVLTTDWCLGKVLTHERETNRSREWLGSAVVTTPETTGSAFTVDYRKTAPDHPLLRGLPSRGRWIITGWSHIVQVIDRNRVRVLLESAELARSHGHGTLLFETQVGRGLLVHFISHAYAQEGEEQDMTAAMMLLANLFDIATARAAGSAAVTPVASGGRWMRLRGPSSALTVTLKADDTEADLRLTRDKARRLLADLADEDGNPFYKYIHPDVPLAEFRHAPGEGWSVRVPEGSANGLLLDGDRVGTGWTALRSGQRLVLFGTRRGRAVEDLSLGVEIPE
ncbi:hypothetical protein KBD49_00075 [Myxococcota bacterium]|nr:hypothetical protein [Myxococcota bacterium]